MITFYVYYIFIGWLFAIIFRIQDDNLTDNSFDIDCFVIGLWPVILVVMTLNFLVTSPHHLAPWSIAKHIRKWMKK